MTIAFNYEEGKCHNCNSYYMYSGKEEFFLCILCGEIIYLEAN
jgi:hypothetical protein